ncbi:MAG: hypothetical protein D6743_19920 [Calditrichaeota bacterium]|nr:MAG: hypothetical protein D6743_19920 [Calditrichota bacterium]
MLSLFRFIRDYGEYATFFVLFAVVIFFFLKEFKLTSKNSWAVLLSLTGLGALVAFQAWRRKRLLQELQRRENALKKIEKRYQELKDQHKLTEEAYHRSKAELERAKVDAGLAILKADEEHARKAEEIEREFENKSAEELLAEIRAIMAGN